MRPSEPQAEERFARKLKRLRTKVIGAIPQNWLDPLLTGKDAISVPAKCRDIERLLNEVRARIEKAFPEEKALADRRT
jgi:hypothetical protein